MSYDRRAEIFVQRRTVSRLLMAIKLYPIETAERDEFETYGGEPVARKPSADGLADRKLNEMIERDFPLVLEYEREISKIEKRMLQKNHEAKHSTAAKKEDATSES